MYWSFHPLADKTNVAYSRKKDTLESIVLFFPQTLVRLFPWTSSETQGLIVGARESLNGRENMARRKVKNGEKSPWGQFLTRPVPNGRRRPGFWLVPENFCVILPNQKPEREETAVFAGYLKTGSESGSAETRLIHPCILSWAKDGCYRAQINKMLKTICDLYRTANNQILNKLLDLRVQK